MKVFQKGQDASIWLLCFLVDRESPVELLVSGVQCIQLASSLEYCRFQGMVLFRSRIPRESYYY